MINCQEQVLHAIDAFFLEGSFDSLWHILFQFLEFSIYVFSLLCHILFVWVLQHLDFRTC